MNSWPIQEVIDTQGWINDHFEISSDPDGVVVTCTRCNISFTGEYTIDDLGKHLEGHK